MVGVHGKASSTLRSNFKLQSNSRIEYAKIGFRNYQNSTNYGGKVECTDAFFKNNEVDTEIKNYTTTQGDYLGTFTNCDFLLDAQYIPGGNYTRRVYLESVSRTTYINCDFINSNSGFLNGTAMEYIALTARKANFQLLGNCDPNVGTCINSNIISGFTYGVYADAISPGAAVSITQIARMKFLCHRGIYISSQNRNKVLNCRFNNMPSGFPANPYTIAADNVTTGSFGIYENNCSGASVAYNTINQLATNFRYGIVMNGCSGGTSWVYKNTLINQRYGVSCWNKNRSASGMDAGVKVQCNIFQSNLYDLWVSDPGTDDGINASIATPQGVFDQLEGLLRSAGNNFSASTSPLIPFDDIRRDNNAIDFTYYFINGEMNPNECSADDQPALFSNLCVNSFLISESGNNANSGTITTTLIQLVHDVEATHDTKAIQLHALVDDGDTPELTEEVLFTTFASALETYDLLMQNSPRLSEAVMIEAIQKEYELPAVLLTQILKSNPTAARSPEINKVLDERMNPLTEYQREEIMEALAWVSQKENIEWQMGFLRDNRNFALDQLWDLYVNDPSVFDPIAAIVPLLDANKWSDDRMWLAELRASTGDFVAASDSLQNYTNYFDASDEMKDEITVLVQLLTWNEQLKNGGTLTSQQWADIAVLAFGGTSQLASLSASMLSPGTNTDVALYDDEEVEPRAMKTRKNAPTTSKVFPNPTASSTTLRFGEYRNHVGIIQILDITGRLVATFNKYDNGQDYFLNMEQLPVGAYSIQLLKQNGEFLKALQVIKQ